MLHLHSQIVIAANRGVLWLRKEEVCIGLIGNEKQGSASQTIRSFTNVAQLGYTICFMPLSLSSLVLLVFFFYSFSSMTLSLPLCFLSPAWLCWHLHSSVFEWKKDERFFSLPVVLSLTHFSPRPVSCVFSPISGILKSPPSMWVSLVCAAGLSCRAGSSPICKFLGGAVCACVLWVICVYMCVWVGVFISVCHACNPLVTGVKPHEKS